MLQQSSSQNALERLETLDVIVSEEDDAMDFLSSVNVHRLYDYANAFEEDTPSNSISFDELQEMYSFDNELKHFVWKWIEPIEVRTRCQFINEISSTGNLFEYRNSDLYKDKSALNKALKVIDKEIKRAKENNVPIVNNNLKTYGDLPVFAMVEICSFGTLSKLCGNLKSEHLKPIAQSFSLSNYAFTTWLRHLVAVRNICAHHNRFYGRPMRMPPKLLKKDSQYSSCKQFPTFIVLKRIYENIDDFACIDFLSELNTIVRKYRHVSLAPIGFPENWKEVLKN